MKFQLTLSENGSGSGVLQMFPECVCHVSAQDTTDVQSSMFEDEEWRNGGRTIIMDGNIRGCIMNITGYFWTSGWFGLTVLQLYDEWGG